jgi:aminomethyltransferase
VASRESSTSTLLRTPLYDRAIALGARMTEFSGWEMPVQFSGIAPEHSAVRTTAGMFDISHMGKFTLRGESAIAQLQRLVPSDLSRLQPGQAQYTVLLNDRAGIIDDIIVYNEGVSDVVVIVNAGTKDKDKEWLLKHLDLAVVEFQDLSSDRALIAVQGPQALQHLQSLVDIDLSNIPNFGHARAQVLGHPAFLARTGYTGEDGFEVMVTPAAGVELWDALIAAGVVPCGLGARDTLRLEAAMCLYGQDISDDTTPLEAGLGWLVHLDTGDFIGRDLLTQQKATGVNRKLVALTTEGRYIARHDYPVIVNGQKIGIVTSGTLSPTLNHPIALAYLNTEFTKIGQVVEVEIRGKLHPATIVKKPFYRRQSN